jgi:hypothetical protein
VSLAIGDVERIAPDQESLNAARKLLKPGGWPLRQREANGPLIWGECQGSGAAPYRVCAHTGDLGYKCSCPSRKFPCKHALALLWAQVDTPQAFAPAARPAWVDDWLSKRRGGSGSGKPAAEDAPKSAAVAGAAEAETVADDPAALARAAAARERAKAAREAAVLAGLDDLDRWLGDHLDQGLAGFAGHAAKSCRAVAQRLVDAKAPGLAGVADELPARLFAAPEPQRETVLLRELGALALAAEAYRRIDALPAPLQGDLRRFVGFNQGREELLADPEALRVGGVWTVAAARAEVQADRLRRLETWLVRDVAEPTFALLLDFVPVSTGAGAPLFIPGEAFEAGLVFYPSAAPLRALIQTRGPAAPPAWPAPAGGLAPALAAYDAALGRQPFARDWPILADDVRIGRADGRFVVTDAMGALALPIERRQDLAAAALAGEGALEICALWDGVELSLMSARAAHGRWFDG